MHKKEKNLFFTKNGSTGLKIGKFLKHLSFSRTRERKSPIRRKGLFRAFKTSLESQLHASEKLYARDRIVVIKHILLVCHVVK